MVILIRKYFLALKHMKFIRISPNFKIIIYRLETFISSLPYLLKIFFNQAVHRRKYRVLEFVLSVKLYSAD